MEKIKINDSDQLYEIESIRQTAEHVLQIAFAGAAPESWEGDIQLYTAVSYTHLTLPTILLV